MVMPARTWLASYERTWLRGDAIAGVTLAAYLLPAAIGDASLAGLPPQAGLYACLFGGLVFWLFCSSRQTTVTITSAISLLVGATLGEMSGGDPLRQATLAACTALMVAALALLAYAVRAGTIVNFFSETVLVGFKSGVALLGEVPRGLPMPAVPLVGRADVNALLPLAMACFVLAAVETTAIGRMFAAKHGYRLDATQEFLAISGANLAAGLGGGFPVSGGMSQSLVNETAGARTPLSGLVAALITLDVVLFFTGLLRSLPQPVLAAIVLVAVTGLVKVQALRHIWRFSRTEFAVAMAALVGVLGSGLLNGVLLGVALSIVLLIHRASRPRVVEIGRVPGTSYFADLVRHPENERVRDVLIARSEGALLYFNVDHVRDQLTGLLN